MTDRPVGISLAAAHKLESLKPSLLHMKPAEREAFVTALRNKRRPLTKAERAAIAEQENTNG